MSAVLFIMINCSSSFSDEKEENGGITAQLILACFAIRICMCVPMDENNVCIACSGACLQPQNADYELSSRAYFKAGTTPTSSCDFWLVGVP